MDNEQSDARSAAVKPWALKVRQTAVADNCAVSVVYERLKRGEYDGFKDGRSTLITVESIERRRAGLPSYHEQKCSPPPRKRGRRSLT